MLNNVPIQINKSARLVTLKHPNSIECSCWRKTVTRVADDTPPDMGGLPTIGGLGVLSSEDESDYEYADIGDGKILFSGVFQAEPGNMVNDGDGLNFQPDPIEATIECILSPDDPGFFVSQKNDLITVFPGNGFVLTYEIVGCTGPVNIPPYTRKYLLNPRQDMNVGI